MQPIDRLDQWKTKGYRAKDLNDPKIRAEVFADFNRDWDCYLCFGMSYEKLIRRLDATS